MTRRAASEGVAGLAAALRSAATDAAEGSRDSLGRAAMVIAARSCSCARAIRGAAAGRGAEPGARGGGASRLSTPVRESAGSRACNAEGARALGVGPAVSTVQAAAGTGAPSEDGDGCTASSCRGCAGVPAAGAANDAMRIGSAMTGRSPSLEGDAASADGGVGAVATDDGEIGFGGGADAGRTDGGLVPADALGAAGAASGEADGVAMGGADRAAISSLAGESAIAEASDVAADRSGEVAAVAGGAVAGGAFEAGEARAVLGSAVRAGSADGCGTSGGRSGWGSARGATTGSTASAPSEAWADGNAGEDGPSTGGVSAARRVSALADVRTAAAGTLGAARAALGSTSCGASGTSPSGIADGCAAVGAAGRAGAGAAGSIRGTVGDNAAVTSGRGGVAGGETVSLPRLVEMISTIIGRFCSRRRSSCGTGVTQASATSAA